MALTKSFPPLQKESLGLGVTSPSNAKLITARKECDQPRSGGQTISPQNILDFINKHTVY